MQLALVSQPGNSELVAVEYGCIHPTARVHVEGARIGGDAGGGSADLLASAAVSSSWLGARGMGVLVLGTASTPAVMGNMRCGPCAAKRV